MTYKNRDILNGGTQLLYTLAGEIRVYCTNYCVIHGRNITSKPAPLLPVSELLTRESLAPQQSTLHCDSKVSRRAAHPLIIRSTDTGDTWKKMTSSRSGRRHLLPGVRVRFNIWQGQRFNLYFCQCTLFLQKPIEIRSHINFIPYNVEHSVKLWN